MATNSKVLKKLLAGTENCRALLREGGWYAVLEISDRIGDDARVLTLLARDDTLVHPGAFYQFHREGFVMVSLLPPTDVFRAGIEGLVRRFGQRR
jgi:alanine-synthesizing transaminase